MDTIINCIKPSGVQRSLDINIFLTSLRLTARTRNQTEEKIPARITTLFATAKKTNLQLHPIKLSRKLKKQMLAWYHIGVPPKLYSGRKADCLKNNHEARTICDVLKTADRLNHHDSGHRPHPDCPCKQCCRDRNKGCKHPHRCAALAQEIAGNLPPKFDPHTKPNKDHLTLTHRRWEKNIRATVSRGDEILFDPSVMTKHHLSKCF